MTETFNHEAHSQNVYGAKGYEDLDAILRENHFNPSKETKNGKTVSLHIEASNTNTIDDKVARLKEILKDWNVSINPMKNQGYISVTLVK